MAIGFLTTALIDFGLKLWNNGRFSFWINFSIICYVLLIIALELNNMKTILIFQIVKYLTEQPNSCESVYLKYLTLIESMYVTYVALLPSQISDKILSSVKDVKTKLKFLR